MPDIKIRKEMPDVALTREQFAERMREHFYDPAFDPLAADVDRIVEVAWHAYDDGRKAPRTQKAGPATPIRTTTCRSNGSRPAAASRRPNAGRRIRRRRRASC